MLSRASTKANVFQEASGGIHCTRSRMLSIPKEEMGMRAILADQCVSSILVLHRQE